MKGKKIDENQIFTGGDVIAVYTEQEAVADGILYDITQTCKEWEKGLFNFVTTNLLSKGYLKSEQVQNRIEKKGS